MRLAIDCDGVLSDFNCGFINILSALRPDLEEALRDQQCPPKAWNYPTLVGFTGEDLTAAWGIVNEDPEFWYTLPDYGPETLEALKSLNAIRQAGLAEVYFVTNRPQGKDAKRQTEEWLEERWFEKPTVIRLTAERKAQFLQELEVDIAIDDKPQTLIDLAEIKTIKTYCCAQPWNRGVQQFWPSQLVVTGVKEMLEKEGLFVGV